MREKIFNIIQIGDKSNRISRAFDIFITITIVSNILVTFLQTFEELDFLSGFFFVVEVITLFIFCVEYVLRIWTADLLYPGMRKCRARLRFMVSFDGVVDILTIVPVFFLSGFVIFRMLRVARIFHLFRLNARYDSFNVITTVLYEKRNQIISSVFIVVILMLASSLCMYSVEHDAQPEVFRNAFSGIWWSGDLYCVSRRRRGSDPDRYHQRRIRGAVSEKEQHLKYPRCGHQGDCGDFCGQKICGKDRGRSAG